MPYANLQQLKLVMLEITSACNFRCTYCPLTRQQRPAVMMRKETAHAVIEQLAALGFRGWLTYNVLGEPLLHPDLEEIMRHTAQCGLQPAVITNGMLLPAHGDVLRRYATSVSISIHHLGQMETRGMAGTVAWHEYIAGIRTFVKAVATDTTGTCNVDVRLDAPPERVTQRAAYQAVTARLARQLATELELPVPSALPVNRRVPLAHNVALAFSEIVDWNLSPKKYMPRRGACTNWRRNDGHFAILADGSVTLCCLDYLGETRAGSVCQQPLAEILNGEPFRTYNCGLQQLRLLLPACRACRGADTRLRAAQRWGHGLLHYWRYQR